MFDVVGWRDFYAMLVADFDDFHNEPDSARKAIHCAITAYHLHEWVWGDLLKPSKQLQSDLAVKDKVSFLKWIEKRTIWFAIVQQLANGSKHFVRNPDIQTSKVGGYGQGPYGMGPYGHAYLLLDLGEGAGEHRWMSAASLLEVVVRFWRDFFRVYQPSERLPVSRYHVD